MPEHFNLPWVIAIENQRLASAGVQVEWTDYAAGTGAMLADLEAGRLDGAVMLTEGVALGLANGLPIRAVSLYTTTSLIWGIHVPHSLDCGSVAELEGRCFAISRRGSGSHLMSLALAMREGWPIDALEFEVVDDLPGAARAFEDGRAQVFLWEHFTTQPQVDAGIFRRLDDLVTPWPAWTFCVTSETWRTRRAVVEETLALVARQANEIKFRGDAAELIGSRYGLDQERVVEWLALTQWVEGLTSADQALADARSMLTAAGAIHT